MTLDNPWVRFSLSGTLILCFGVVDLLARRAGHTRVPAAVPAPAWTRTVVAVSLTAFYALIGPTGGSLAGGWGNALGVAGVLAALLARWRSRHGTARVRQPATAARVLFYAALPAALGVPWGWLVFTLPALATSAWCAMREDRVLLATLGEPHRARMAGTYRWVPGVW